MMTVGLRLRPATGREIHVQEANLTFHRGASFDYWGGMRSSPPPDARFAGFGSPSGAPLCLMEAIAALSMRFASAPLPVRDRGGVYNQT